MAYYLKKVRFQLLILCSDCLSKRVKDAVLSEGKRKERCAASSYRGEANESFQV